MKLLISKADLTFWAIEQGGTDIRRWVRFFGFCHLACRGYVYVGRVRNLFSKILQGVRFLVDGYVYKGPNSTHQ